MSKSSKDKFQPIIITTREMMVSVLNRYVADKIAHAQLTLSMEEEIATIQKRYQKRLDDLGRSLGTAAAGLQVWAESNRAEEFAEKKSIDLQLATIGFRDTPHRVEKVRSKETFEEIAKKMAGIILKDAAGEVIFNGEDYVAYADPALAKQALLADRQQIPAEALKLAGLRFTYDENFFIAPKSEVLEGTTVEVAA